MLALDALDLVGQLLHAPPHVGTVELVVCQIVQQSLNLRWHAFGRIGQGALHLTLRKLGPLQTIDVPPLQAADVLELDLQRRDLATGVLLHLQARANSPRMNDCRWAMRSASSSAVMMVIRPGWLWPLCGK